MLTARSTSDGLLLSAVGSDAARDGSSPAVAVDAAARFFLEKGLENSTIPQLEIFTTARCRARRPTPWAQHTSWVAS